ncbi:MAG TPA: TolC family protein [Gammaproteobacteria bacterium]|nr:TolC family protein [Gammaproteobacteria bacterium]
MPISIIPGISWSRPLLALITLSLLGGCATYRPQPLPKQAPLEKDLPLLVAKVNRSIKTKSDTYRVNLADGLDLTEVAIVAVLGNPDLRARRAELKVAGAQAFAAGLLPDPQLSTNIDHPTTTGYTNGLGFGLGYDIIPLITRQARISAAQGRHAKVRLQLLWQEWQVIQQARSLAVRFQLEQQRLALLRRMRDLYQQRYQHSKQGLADGNITLDVNGTDLTALVDSFSQISQLEQQHNQTHYDLNHLLGLQPDAVISLTKLPAETSIDQASVQAQLRKLPTIRPDLLALKAGYQAQEERVRAAILAQFPSFSIGINRVRDTSNVYTGGFSIRLNLPLFSGNRGAIAIERATRKQLFEEYQARIAQTHSDVRRLLKLQTIIEKQRNNLQLYLPRLKVLVKRARRAYRHGDINVLTFLNMESTWVNKRLEQISLQQTQWQNRIALQTLLALPEAGTHAISTLANKVPHRKRTGY